MTLSDAAGARAFTEGADAQAGRAYVVFGTDAAALTTAMQPIAMSISPVACAVSSSKAVASELGVQLAEPPCWKGAGGQPRKRPVQGLFRRLVKECNDP